MTDAAVATLGRAGIHALVLIVGISLGALVASQPCRVERPVTSIDGTCPSDGGYVAGNYVVAGPSRLCAEQVAISVEYKLGEVETVLLGAGR